MMDILRQIKTGCYKPRFLRLVVLMLMMGCSVTMHTAPAYAAGIPHGSCTTDDIFKESDLGKQGLITILVKQIKEILESTQRDMYKAITSAGSFVSTVRAAITMYICFYGIMFTVGMVDITLIEFTRRMVKLGIVVALISGDSWALFNETFVKFFNDGTDEWISAMSAAAVGAESGGEPFEVIDDALSTAISAKVAVNLMAMFFTPPYGPILGLLMALGAGSFVKAILQAAWVYLMSLIVKALLFGIAPIFLACILFQHTYYLFTGWLNQLINASLQPILLFTFLAFFFELIKAAISNIITTPVCWTEWGDSLRGSPFSVNYWRYALCEEENCTPYTGKWGFTGATTGGGEGPVFPVPVLGVITLVLLADLCSRFSSVVMTIASEIAQASMNLASMNSPMGEWFRGGHKPGSKPQDGGFLPPNERVINASPDSAVQGAAKNAAAAVGVRPSPTPTPPPAPPKK